MRHKFTVEPTEKTVLHVVVVFDDECSIEVTDHLDGCSFKREGLTFEQCNEISGFVLEVQSDYAINMLESRFEKIA